MKRIMFGDNQFFGINHASEERARQQAIAFQSPEAIIDVLRAATGAGVNAFMCTTHRRIGEITSEVRSNPDRWKGLEFYPCMPYAHKYADAVGEMGLVDAIKSFIPASGMLDAALRGGKALVSQDVGGLASLLIDAEMKPFEGLECPVIFLQNVVTDLLLGLGYHDAFTVFRDHVRNQFKAEAGFITMNLPMLLGALSESGIENPIVCANINKAGFRMSGGVAAYREATARWPARVIAMSVFASGAIAAEEALEWVINERYVRSILFGASSKRNIENTVNLINRFDSQIGVAAPG